MSDVDIAILVAKVNGANEARLAAERVEIALAAELLREQLLDIKQDAPRLLGVWFAENDEGGSIPSLEGVYEDDLEEPDAWDRLCDTIPWCLEACAFAAGLELDATQGYIKL